MQPKVHQGLLNAQGFRFALVVSRWNDFLTSKLTEGAIDALERLGAEESAVEIYKVPGSFELPLTARKVAESGNFDAVICIGVVIRGETPHFDYVAGEAAKGTAAAAMVTSAGRSTVVPENPRGLTPTIVTATPPIGIVSPMTASSPAYRRCQ